MRREAFPKAYNVGGGINKSIIIAFGQIPSKTTFDLLWRSARAVNTLDSMSDPPSIPSVDWGAKGAVRLPADIGQEVVSAEEMILNLRCHFRR